MAFKFNQKPFNEQKIYDSITIQIKNGTTKSKKALLKEVKDFCYTIYKNVNDSAQKQFESKQCILYDGDINSKIMTIGKDLGKEELEKNKLLIGPTGSLYRYCELMLDIDSFKCNLVPFKSSYNNQFSIYTQAKFYYTVKSMIEIIKPKAIVTLGFDTCATLCLMPYNSIINVIVNQVALGTQGIPIFPAVHPSYLLRNGITIESIKTNKKHRRNFKELFFGQIYKAVQETQIEEGNDCE